MAKQHYFVRLVAPRPTFPFDMNDDERRLMQAHAAYMKELFAAGTLVIYGPVLTPGAPFGMGVVEADDEASVRRVFDADPTVIAGLNTYDVSPMRIGAARAV